MTIFSKKIGGLGLIAVLVALASSAIVASSATAACYPVFLYKTGNYSDSACTNKVANLTGEYVLAEFTARRIGRVDCAKLTEATGEFSDNLCRTRAIDGLFTRIVLPVAAPRNLPLLSEGEREVTGASEGESKIVAGPSEIVCKEETTTGKESKETPGGPITVDFKGCASAGAKCQSLSDESGVILASGEWGLVFDETSPELLTATVIEIETVHLSCGGLILVEIKGSTLCLDLKPTETSKTHSLHCIGNKSEATEKHYIRETEEVPVKLECSINHEAFKECAITALGNVKTSEELHADV